MSDIILPIVDVDVFLASADSEASSRECKKVCLIVLWSLLTRY